MTHGYTFRFAVLCLALCSVGCTSRSEGTGKGEAASSRPAKPEAPKPAAAQENPVKESSTNPSLALGASLECTMEVDPTLRAGAPVRLRFVLRNPTAQPVYVLKWQTPLEGLFDNFLQVTRDGAEIPFNGPVKKRGNPSKDSYALVAPGQSLEASLDVSLAYEMRQPGRYHLVLRNALMDATPNEAEVPRTLEQFQATKLQCPEIEFTLSP